MAKKVSAKSATKNVAKKPVKKAKSAALKSVKKAAAEKPVVSEQISQAEPVVSVLAPATEVTAAVAEVASQAAPSNDSSSTKIEESMPTVEAKTEEKPMADESKGVGKEYNASEFSQPATEAGAGSSKVYLYVGLSIVVLAAIVGGLFFLGGFSSGGNTDSGLTGSTITAYCSDTDGGYNRFTKGVANGIYYLDYSTGDFMDHCEDNDANKLTEYYCKNDLVVYTTEPCPDGLTCESGICA